MKLAKAEQEHYAQILEISKDVYDGHDYIEQVYSTWIQQEVVDPEKRRNLILLSNEGRVIGYQSFFFQNNGTKVIAQATRVDPSLRGKGVGRALIQQCQDYLAKTRPLANELKAIWHRNIDVTKHRDPAMGKIVDSKICLFYNLPKEAIGGRGGNSLKMTTRKALGELFDSHLLNEFFNETRTSSGSYLTLAWIPYCIQKGADFESISPYESESVSIMVDDLDHPKSLSFASGPFKAANGINIALDLFAQDFELLKTHILQQIDRMYRHIIMTGDGVRCLWVSCDPKNFEAVYQFFKQDLKLKESGGKLYGPCEPEKEVPIYFVYEKPVL